MPDRPEEDGRAHINFKPDSVVSSSMLHFDQATKPTTTPPLHMASSLSAKSNSLPSTPAQRPDSPPNGRLSPSTQRPTRDNSPHSINSGINRMSPPSRRPGGRCRYETALTMARRRVLYSVGSEKLEAAPKDAAKKLGPAQETTLTSDMTTLYEQLLPTTESETRRERLVSKIAQLLHTRWPGHHIKVSVFGSTGNKLGTRDSDVDLCITTNCKEIEHVCSIAELLATHGMERVVCVSSAKVPIVKFWDPDLQVACDTNVNNPIALENTTLIRSYVEIDDRFRPLAMIVKHWAKRRMLNDAALGGTLSSYTWICLVLNFLQTRDPAILPSLQKTSGLKPHVMNGVNVAFDKDLENYRNFGKQNTSTLGQLLCQFFRYYGHEVDFETAVMSVRLGKVVKKTEKAWHLLQENRLCVEEPFNVSRNLGNTADDTSMRGIHLELRRAFNLVVAGKFDECCEQYIREQHDQPPRQSESFILQPTRAIIPQAPPVLPAQQTTNRSNRNGTKGNRNAHRHSGGGGRRASNPAGRGSTHLRDLPFAMTPQELQLQAQHQQHLLHDQLFQQYQYLQMQEQELRMQLYRQRGLMAANGYVSSVVSTVDSTDDGQESSLSRNSTSARVPMTAPLYPQRFAQAGSQLSGGLPSPGIMTNPGSPLMLNTVPDSRRYTRRASLNNAAQNSLRAHSQPARIVPMMSSLQQIPQGSGLVSGDVSRRESVTSMPQDAASAILCQQAQMQRTLYDAGRRPVEYVGYYLGQSPSIQPWSRSAGVSPIPSNAGLAIHHGGLSPRLSSRNSRLPSTFGTPSMQAASLSTVLTDSLNRGEQATKVPTRLDASPPSRRSGPLIVDGSMGSPPRRPLIVDGSINSPPRVTGVTAEGLAQAKDDANVSITTSEDIIVTTPPGSDDMSLASDNVQVVESINDMGAENQLVDPEKTPQPMENAVVWDKPRVNGVFNTIQHRKASTSYVESNFSQGNAVKQHLRETINGDVNGQSIDVQSSGVANKITMPLTPITNGQTAHSIPAIATESAPLVNGWQTQSKKKKKNRQSRSDLHGRELNTIGGEVPPEDDSLRKGG